MVAGVVTLGEVVLASRRCTEGDAGAGVGIGKTDSLHVLLQLKEEVPLGTYKGSVFVDGDVDGGALVVFEAVARMGDEVLSEGGLAGS